MTIAFRGLKVKVKVIGQANAVWPWLWAVYFLVCSGWCAHCTVCESLVVLCGRLRQWGSRQWCRDSTKDNECCIKTPPCKGQTCCLIDEQPLILLVWTVDMFICLLLITDSWRWYIFWRIVRCRKNGVIFCIVLIMFTVLWCLSYENLQLLNS